MVGVVKSSEEIKAWWIFLFRALVERSALEKRKALSSSETERGRKGLQPLRCRSVEISLIS